MPALHLGAAIGAEDAPCEMSQFRPPRSSGHHNRLSTGGSNQAFRPWATVSKVHNHSALAQKYTVHNHRETC